MSVDANVVRFGHQPHPDREQKDEEEQVRAGHGVGCWVVASCSQRLGLQVLEGAGSQGASLCRADGQPG